MPVAVQLVVVLAVDIGEDVPVAVAVQLVVVLSDIGEGVPVCSRLRR